MIKFILIVSVILLIALGILELTYAHDQRDILWQTKMYPPEAYDRAMKEIRFDKFRATFHIAVGFINAAAAYHLHKLEKITATQS